MNDDRHSVEEELPAFVARRLGAQRSGDIEAWIAERAGRDEFVADWMQIVQGLKEGGAALALACPEPTRLIEWARGQSTDPTGHIPRHVETCASCSLEVEASRRNRRRRAEPVRIPVSRGLYRFAGFAAAAALALGIGVGMAIDQLRVSQAPVPQGGAADLLQIVPSLRGGSGLHYQLAPGQPFVPVALLPELPANVSDTEVFRFSILEAGGGEVWSEELTAAAIQSRLAVSGVLILLVPSQRLEPGTYAMRIAPSLEGAPALLHASFSVD